MKIAKHSVAAIHYTLTDNTGKVLDSSAGRDPLYYLHG
jgi:FKBP-type peptidyl-prolyl cis-trans isomerase SlyD